MDLFKFMKNWTLPLAMLAGVIGYFVFANFTFLEPTKPFMNGLISFLTPSLIFAQLLLTFCKIEPKELVPRVWHGWLLAIQAISCGIIALLLIFCPMDESYKEIFEAAMVCLICPTATAAAVITGKLGGSASSLTTYTLLSNILAAIAVPLIFPLVEPHTDVTFGIAFLKILSKVFPLLLAPFFIALLFRYYIPRLHKFLLKYHTSAFYLWAVALTIVMGQTTRSLVNSTADVTVEMLIAFAGLVTCCLQFYFGKRIGSAYNDRISAGQALGQKNTVLAIWMAVTYLNPLSSVGPGSYVVWQNIINSYQLWKKRKNEPSSFYNKKDEQDRKDFELILEAYNFKGYDKGRRGIHMRLLHMGILMNHKKISRLMKKYKLFYPIRKANPARRMAKAIKTSNYADNVLNRHFDEYGPGYVLETDITYLFYGPKRSKAYLSVVKDGFTKQILSYVLSTSLEEDFVLKTINQLFEKHKHDIHTDALIHSDQGAHYTSIRFIDLLKSLEIRQSMSRRGNCWDNAPQKSFLGHMKDEIGKYIEITSTYDGLEKVINNYMDYYNNERYQYKLAKLSPNEFFEYYKTGNYPLDHITKEPVEYKKKFK